jgi:hypothetical protein
VPAEGAPVLSLRWWDFVGFAGVLLVLAAYLMLQTGRLRGDGARYSLINLVGAAGILVPVWYAPQMNWSVFFIEAAWIAISMYGLWHWTRRKHTRRKGAPPEELL